MNSRGWRFNSGCLSVFLQICLDGGCQTNYSTFSALSRANWDPEIQFDETTACSFPPWSPAGGRARSGKRVTLRVSWLNSINVIIDDIRNENFVDFVVNYYFAANVYLKRRNTDVVVDTFTLLLNFIEPHLFPAHRLLQNVASSSCKTVTAASRSTCETPVSSVA